MGFADRPAQHREILRIDIDHAPVDRAPAGDHAVTGVAGLFHAEIVRPVDDEHVEFFKTALVQQQLDPFACGQLALGMLRRDARLAATRTGHGTAAVQLAKDILHVVPSMPRQGR